MTSGAVKPGNDGVMATLGKINQADPVGHQRGLVPAIHVLFDAATQKDVDARHKAGHDEGTHIQET